MGSRSEAARQQGGLRHCKYAGAELVAKNFEFCNRR